MNMRKSFLCAVMATILLLLLAACGGTKTAAGEAESETVGIETGTVDPGMADSDVISGAAAYTKYADYEPVQATPGGAGSWNQS